jgi:hypothetical protein
MNRQATLLALAAALAMWMSACGSPKPLTIAITTAPPASMEINATTSIAATVTNDPSSGGVDWSCTPAAACGTFSPAHTASGATTIYQAPSASGTVTLTAASTTKPTVTKSVTVTINPVGTTSNLNGAYTFYANGWNPTRGSYSVAGSVVLDGHGNVTGGEQDYFSLDFNNIVSTVIPDDPIQNGGSITLGNDGRGTLTITPTTAPPETFSVTLVNNDHLLITEFDLNATSTGSMDLQTAPASMPANSNAMTLYDPADGVVLGGIVSVSGISVTGGEGDVDDAGFQAPVTFSGSLTAPDAAGRGTMILNAGPNLQFTYYVVGPEVFRIIETDGDLSTGTNYFFAGSMYGQGAASNAFSPASLNGNFVFEQAGETVNAFPAYGAAGQFTADGSSKLTGITDVNIGDGAPLAAVPLAGGGTTATYTVDATGYGSIALPTAIDGLANFGVYLVDPSLNIADPNSTTGGGGALLLDLDSSNWGIGTIVPQATGPTFTGNYAYSQDGSWQTNITSGYFDILGQFLSDGVSNLAGTVDYNDVNDTQLNPAVMVAGTFTPDGSNPGRSTATLTLTGQTTPNNVNATNITLYQASSSLLLHVDMDSTAPATGIIAVGALQKQQ